MIRLNRHKFLEWMDQRQRPLLSDGAMGTMLHAHGVSFDQCFDYLNLTHPGTVAEVHQAYLDAGADIILTNTFGANRYKLADHGLQNSVVEINIAGVKLARPVTTSSDRKILLAGDIGPLGVRMVPFGRVTKDMAYAAFSEQVQALLDAGVDILVIETITDLN